MVDRPQGCELFHHRAFATEGGQGHAPANHFAQHRQVGLEAWDGLGVNALRTAQSHAAAGHHLVKHQQYAVLAAQLAAALHEGDAGAHKVHVAGDGLDHQASQLFAVQGEGFFQLGNVVELQHQGVLHHFGWYTGAGGVAKGSQARTGFHQQSVGVAVVTALELDDLAAAGGATGQAQGAHTGLGARTHQAHHLHRRHQL